MACGVYVGYGDQVLRDVYEIPGWGIAYVVALSVLAELAALFPGQRPVAAAAPRTLDALSWTASAVLLLVAAWQLVVVFTVESQSYLSGGTARTVWACVFAPLFAVPVLMTAVTWSYARRRHRAWSQA